MAKVFTNDEKREIEEKAKYILTAMDDIGKNGDAYCTDEQLFRASKTVRPSLTGQRYRTDKALLLQAEFLHREGYHLYAQRTWAYEVTAAKRLADILKDPALPVVEIPKELRAGDILLSEQQREAIELALNSRAAARPRSSKPLHVALRIMLTFSAAPCSPPPPARLHATSPSAPALMRVRFTARSASSRIQTFWTLFPGAIPGWSSSTRRRWYLWRCSRVSSTVSAEIAASSCLATRTSCRP